MLEEMDDKHIKKILFIIFAFFWIIFIAKGQEAKSQEVSVSIPAISEIRSLSQSSWTIDDMELRKSETLGIRSNTPWTIAVSGKSSGFLFPLQYEKEISGQANSDESYQEEDLSYIQPLSWTDKSGSIEISYSLLPTLP